MKRMDQNLDHGKRSLLWESIMIVFLITVMLPGVVGSNTNYNRNERARNRQTRSDCSSSSIKGTFPDVDYAFLGYNIIKGYPRSFGHDPGFTTPIFEVNYTTGRHSADCRYSIPNGYLIIPDISCSTSFSSSTIETTYEFSQSLSSSVDVGLSTPAFAFKASSEFKESTSYISSGEHVYIISSARCQYYFAQLDTDNPPQFSVGFLHWATMLSKSNDKQLYMDFLDRFGTHFSTSLDFGAEYVYQHKMDSSKYKSEEQAGINVKESANFYDEVSLSGGFSLDASARQSASRFSKLVSTSTFSIGAAPPGNGDALTWASTVKENPVPVKYKLAPIADLFTKNYMSSLNITYSNVFSKLTNYSKEYCLYLQNKGYVDNCEDNDGQLQLSSTRLWTHFTYKQVGLLSDCISHCKAIVGCFAVSYLKSGHISKTRFTCFLFDGSDNVYGTFTNEWESILFQQPKNSSPSFTIKNTSILGPIQGNTPRTMSITECKELCLEQPSCTGFSICHCSDDNNCKCKSRRHPCKLFSHGSIQHLYQDNEANSYVFLHRVAR